ncbi:MAG: group 1 truncated hemoglobin [Burkholderiales bacterium]
MTRIGPHFAAALLAAALVAGGCASPPAESASLYQRLGGRDAIEAVVDDAIVNISADPRINQRFASATISHLKRDLVDLLCSRSGGPCLYAGRDMASAHEGMNIRDDEFDALMEDLVKSLDKFKVPAREKNEALTILGRMKNAITGH